MAKLSVAERLEKIAARKLKDERLEARLKLSQKKADSRSAAEIARLAIKTGLDRLGPAALHGCFLQAAADALDGERVAAWEALAARSSTALAKDERIIAIARFPAKPAAEVVAALRQHGFRWNGLLGQYEGRVFYEAAAAVVAAAGGIISPVIPRADDPAES